MKSLRLLTAVLCIASCSHAFAEVQDIDKELSDLAERLAVPIKDHGKTKVAVIDFANLTAVLRANSANTSPSS